MQIHAEAPLFSGIGIDDQETADLPEKAQDLEFKELSDVEQLRKLLTIKNHEEPFAHEAGNSPVRSGKSNELPTTLGDALKMKGCLFTNLVKLAIRLRNGQGGMDVGFLPNAKNCRKASRSLNWYQQLVC